MPRDRIGDLGVEMHRRTGSTQHQQEAQDSTGRLQSEEENKGCGDGGKADDLSQKKNPSLRHSQLSNIFLLPSHSCLLKESLNLQVVWTIKRCTKPEKRFKFTELVTQHLGCARLAQGEPDSLYQSPSPSFLTKKYLGNVSEEPGEILGPKYIK